MIKAYVSFYLFIELTLDTGEKGRKKKADKDREGKRTQDL